MKVLPLFLTLLLAAAPHVHAADPDLEAANRAYSYGSYPEAVQLTQKLIDQRGYSAALCYNLANAESRAGHPGLALLNYERARFLAPGDKEIDHNLQLTRQQAGLQPNSYRWWQVMIRSINWVVWLALAGACVALIIFALVANSLARGQGRTPLRLVCRAIFFTCIPLALLFGYVELDAIGFNDRIEGVVVANKQASLYLSPFSSAEKAGSLPEGELVTVMSRRDNFLYIVGRDKQSGWIEKRDLEPIIPGSFDVKPAAGS